MAPGAAIATTVSHFFQRALRLFRLRIPLCPRTGWTGSDLQATTVAKYVLTYGRTGLSRPAIPLIVFVILCAKEICTPCLAPSDFNGYGYSYVRSVDLRRETIRLSGGAAERSTGNFRDEKKSCHSRPLPEEASVVHSTP